MPTYSSYSKNYRAICAVIPENSEHSKLNCFQINSAHIARYFAQNSAHNIPLGARAVI